MICNAEGILLDSVEITAPANGGLYLGGIPYLLREAVEKAAMVGSTNGFVGTLGDVVFIDEKNVRMIDMNEPLSLEKAQVGREMFFPKLEIVPDNWKASLESIQSQQAAGCDDHVEDAAFFTSASSSQAIIRLSKSQKRRHFLAKLQVRTNQEDGTIMAVEMPARKGESKGVLLVSKRNHSIVAETLDESGALELLLVLAFDLPSRWNSLELGKKGALLELKVGELSESVTLSKRIRLGGEIYLGSVSEPFDKMQIKSFDGCIKDLLINGTPFHLWSEESEGRNLEKCPECGFY